LGVELGLRRLRNRNVPVWIIGEIEKDLDFETNEVLFNSLLEVGIESPQVQQYILSVLNLAKKAHGGANHTYKIPKDKEGLDNIPYVNHSIQAAIMALRKKLSPEAIMASLLHDVIEDLQEHGYTFERVEEELLNAGIPTSIVNKIMEMLRDLTKTSDETREEYMNRTKNLKGEPKLIKCFDRYHNLLRAFTREKPKYFERYIQEVEQYFKEAFETLPELADMNDRLERLITSLSEYKKVLEKG